MSAGPNVATTRQRLESAVERAIELLNALDGDCDLEPDDDGEAETDLGALEDEITPGMYRGHHGPGCAVFDGI